MATTLQSRATAFPNLFPLADSLVLPFKSPVLSGGIDNAQYRSQLSKSCHRILNADMHMQFLNVI
jgi:hypothetical protein